MATTTTMNRWTEELVQSLLSPSVQPSKARRTKTQFNRFIRHHNYARTNQFEIEERLSGLEEKFQVLNHDDLSDALRQRRTELLQHQDKWIPDVLDFLLRLSKDPVTDESLNLLSKHTKEDITVPQLRWADVEQDDPVNRSDRMWRQPEYSDFSSDDEFVTSSATTSPESVRGPPSIEHQDPQLSLTKADGGDLSQRLKQGLASASGKEQVVLTEMEVVRETLFMLQGLPTSLFTNAAGQRKRHARYKVAHMSDGALNSILARAMSIAGSASTIRGWSADSSTIRVVRALEDSVVAILRDFDANISDLHTDMVKARTSGGVCSLLATVESIHTFGVPIVAVAQYVTAAKSQDVVGLLDVLYTHVCRAETVGPPSTFAVLLEIFCKAVKALLVPVTDWVESGVLPEQGDNFFVQRNADQHDKAKLWHNWFTIKPQGPTSLPSFLTPYAQQIFIAGKTMTFRQALSKSSSSTTSNVSLTLPEALDSAALLASTSIAPFAASLSTNISQYITNHLASNTQSLQALLDTTCNLSVALTALSDLYFATSAVATIDIDTHIFTSLDRALHTWNDAFLLTSIITTALPHLEASHLNINSTPLPTTITFRTARKSISILSHLTVTYTPHWALANILPPAHITVYQRVGTLLLQIRYALYALQTHGASYHRSHSSASNSNSTAAHRTQCSLQQSLHILTTTIYLHLTQLTIPTLTATFRRNLASARTVDEMLAMHASYLASLERACPTGPKAKVLRETLLGLLDLGVGLGWAVKEARRKKVKSGDGEGLVEAWKVSEMRTALRRGSGLLVAGLRGMGRVGAAGGVGVEGKGDDGVGAMLELLADGLEGRGFRS